MRGMLTFVSFITLVILWTLWRQPQLKQKLCSSTCLTSSLWSEGKNKWFLSAQRRVVCRKEGHSGVANTSYLSHVWVFNGDETKDHVLFVQLRNLFTNIFSHWFSVFSPEFSAPERAHRHTKWPHFHSYGPAATVWPLQPCPHPARPTAEGAVGGQVRVPALLHWILRRTGERVALSLPVLP